MTTFLRDMLFLTAVMGFFGGAMIAFLEWLR